MLTFKSYASSSKGNFNTLSNGHSTIILDCGVPFKEVKKKLKFKTSDVDGVLATHLHADHVKGVPEALKSGLDCYMLKETAEHLKVENHHRCHIIEFGKQFVVGGFKVKPFDLVHMGIDGEPVPCCGFLIVCGGEKAVYITDTAYCKYKFPALDLIAVECNYDLDIVRGHVESGAMKVGQKNRLLQSHFGLENVIDFIKANDMSRVKEIYLLHLSAGNSDAARFEREIKKITGVPVYVSEE